MSARKGFKWSTPKGFLFLSVLSRGFIFHLGIGPLAITWQRSI